MKFGPTRSDVTATPEALRAFQSEYGGSMNEVAAYLLTIADGVLSSDRIFEGAKALDVRNRGFLREGLSMRIADFSATQCFEPPLIIRERVARPYRSTVTGKIAAYFLSITAPERAEFDQPVINDILATLDFLRYGPEHLFDETQSTELLVGRRAAYHATELFYRLHKITSEPLDGNKASRQDYVDTLLAPSEDPQTPDEPTITIVIDPRQRHEFY
jgi:hypothetical protein